MTSNTRSNDVDLIKTTIYGPTKINGDYCRCMANLDISVFIHSTILNLCTVLKYHDPVNVKHGKCIFVPRGEYLRMCTINLDLIMQKGSRVVEDDNRTLMFYLKNESKK